MKHTKLFCKAATAFCALSLFVGQLTAQMPCYGIAYQPKFPANAEKLMKR